MPARTRKEREVEDKRVLDRIGELVEEEHQLERQASESGLDGGEEDRLRQLEVQLDQCWDLLRQRRARRDAGLDPDDAHTRGADTVEGYLQ
jgi:hypothetical protein